ncbi:hypothetical protein Tco_0394591, partial [Tanacetum coccineum]
MERQLFSEMIYIWIICSYFKNSIVVLHSFIQLASQMHKLSLSATAEGDGNGQSEEYERPGVIISNHVSHMDILYHMSSSFPSFVAKASLILGFPSILLATVSGQSGSLVGQRSTCNRVCGREYSSAVSVCPRSITSLKCVLTQEHLDAICAKYFVPEEVHPQLPSSDATMHERPAGKVGMYTRFFDYANYRIPFSTFFVSVLTHFRIPFSQLSVFGSAKDNVEPIVPITEHVETETPRPKRTKKKRVIRGSEKTPAASHPPKRLRADYGTTGGSATGASPLEEGGYHTDSVTGPSLRTVGPSARFVVLSDSSHHSGAKSADPEVDSLVRSAIPVMTEATTVTTIATCNIPYFQ